MLLRAASEGDRAAFEEIYRRYAPWLTVTLQRRCPDAALVDDAVQETFLGIWRGKAHYREQPGGEVAGWLWRIGSRRLADATRRQGAGRRLLQLLGGLGDHRLRASSAEEELLSGLPHGDLNDAMERLPAELRTVLHATVVDGLSTREAAVALRIPEGTVKTRAMRARRRLQQELA